MPAARRRLGVVCRLLRPMLWGNQDHGQVRDVNGVGDGDDVSHTVIVIDSELEGTASRDFQTCRDAFAFLACGLLVCYEVVLIRGHAAAGKGIDTYPEGVGIKSDVTGSFVGAVDCAREGSEHRCRAATSGKE